MQIATCPVGTCTDDICKLSEFAKPSWPRCFCCCQADFALRMHRASELTCGTSARGRPSAKHPRSNFRALSHAHTPQKFRPCSFIERRFFLRAAAALSHAAAQQRRARRGQQRHQSSDALDNGPGRRRRCGRPRPDAVSHSAAAISLTALRTLYRKR